MGAMVLVQCSCQQPPALGKPPSSSSPAPPPAASTTKKFEAPSSPIPPPPAPSSTSSSPPEPSPEIEQPNDELSDIQNVPLLMNGAGINILKSLIHAKKDASKALFSGAKDIARVKISGIVAPIHIASAGMKNLTRTYVDLGSDIYNTFRNTVREALGSLRSNIKPASEKMSCNDNKMVMHPSAKCNVSVKVLSCEWVEDAPQQQQQQGNDEQPLQLCLIEMDINDCEDSEPMPQAEEAEQPKAAAEPFVPEGDDNKPPQNSSKIVKRSIHSKYKVQRFRKQWDMKKPRSRRSVSGKCFFFDLLLPFPHIPPILTQLLDVTLEFFS